MRMQRDFKRGHVVATVTEPSGYNMQSPCLEPDRVLRRWRQPHV